MPGTKIKTINQYCSVCKRHFDMEEVKQGSSKGVVWLKCPGCQGFLPYMADEQEENTDGMANAKADAQELALEDLDVENAREYDEDETYDIGDVVHHRSWNDFGKVVSKGELPGGRKTVWVQFLRQGRIQLLEGVK
ncbi:MAG: hypothetical protein V3V49_10265 [Candidatus Krumholzibacteria bacterium]